MKHELDPLLKVRKLREQVAARQLRQARAVVVQCEQALTDAQRSADEFCRQRPQQEAALFAELQNQCAQRQHVEAFQGNLRALAEQQDTLDRLRDQAADAVQVANQALLQATGIWRAAARSTEKLSDFVAQAGTVAARELENAAELEAEEFMVPRQVGE